MADRHIRAAERYCLAHISDGMTGSTEHAKPAAKPSNIAMLAATCAQNWQRQMEAVRIELFCHVGERVQDARHLRCATEGKHVFRKCAVLLFCKVFLPQDDGFRLSCCHAAQLGEE